MESSTGVSRRINVHSVIDDSKFNGFFKSLCVIIFLALLFDGFDMQVYGATLTVMSKDLNLNSSATGLLASTSLWGCVVGGVIMGYLTDKWGRKTVLVMAILLYAVFTALCGLLPSLATFAVCRFISGLGIVTMTPTTTAVLSEFSPKKGRPLLVTTVEAGVGFGQFLVPLLTIALLPALGWRGMYVLGVVALLLIPFILRLPETMVLQVKRGQNEQIGNFLHRMNPSFEPKPDDVYEVSQKETVKTSVASLFKNGLARNTILIWIMFFVNMFLMFSFLTWLPKLITLLGYSLTNSLLLTSAFTLGTVVACPVVGKISDTIGYKKAFMGLYMLTALALILLTVRVNIALFVIFLFILGFGFVFLSLTYPFVSTIYPISVRATGLGTGASIARIGSAVAPIVLGFLLQAKFSVNSIFYLMLIPVAIAFIAVSLTEKPQHEN